MRKTLAFVAVVASAAHAAEPGPEWTGTLEADAVWQHATPAGVLVAGTRSGVVGLDQATGRILWHIDDLRDPEHEALDVLPRPPYVVLGLRKGIRGDSVRVVIDATTGREAWNSASLGFVEVYDQLYVPSLDALIFSGRMTDGNLVVEADLASGRRRCALAVPEGQTSLDLRQPSLFDTESTLVIVTESRLTCYHLGTGAIAWVSPELQAGPSKPCPTTMDLPGQETPERQDPRPLPPYVALQLAQDGRHIFVIRGPTLYAVDARDGHALWPAPPRLCGRSVQALEVEGGVIVWTMPAVSGADELVMLDGATGAVRWQYPKPARGVGGFLKSVGVMPDAPLGNPVVRGSGVHTFSGKNLVRIDLATGKSAKIAKTQIDEEGLPWLEGTSEGFLVIGQQDVEWLDAEGKSLRHVHYDAPGDEGAALRMAGVTAALNAIDTVCVDRGRLIFAGQSYGPAMERFLYEYHATSRLDSLIFVLAELGEADVKGPALVAIDRRTGDAVRRIPVSKEPRYAVDPMRGRIFVVEKKTIRCYGL